MKAISLFDELEFTSAISKDAYLEASKWLANNIISKDYKNIIWKIDKLGNTELPTFKLSLYCEYEITTLFKSRCKACKEFHSSFYINQQLNCDACNAKGLMDHTKEKLRIIKKYYETK